MQNATDESGNTDSVSSEELETAEDGDQTPSAQLGDAVGSPLVPRVKRIAGAAGREALGVLAALATYPFGVVERNVTDVSPRTHAPPLVANPRFYLNPGAYDIPVFLIHGYAHNHSAYMLLRNRLHKIGFTHVHSLNYNPWLHDIPTVAKRLERRIEEVCETAGQPAVHLVGHSMGGVACRYYVQRLGGADRALQVIMIGSPQNGTLSASTMRFLGRTARQLSWNSRFFRELNASPADPLVRFTSIWSRSDELVIPAESARMCPAAFNSENVHVPGEGHLSLLLSPKVIGEILDRLCDIDALPKLDLDDGVSHVEATATAKKA